MSLSVLLEERPVPFRVVGVLEWKLGDGVERMAGKRLNSAEHLRADEGREKKRPPPLDEKKKQRLLSFFLLPHLSSLSQHHALFLSPPPFMKQSWHWSERRKIEEYYKSLNASK